MLFNVGCTKELEFRVIENSRWLLDINGWCGRRCWKANHFRACLSSQWNTVFTIYGDIFVCIVKLSNTSASAKHWQEYRLCSAIWTKIRTLFIDRWWPCLTLLQDVDRAQWLWLGNLDFTQYFLFLCLGGIFWKRSTGQKQAEQTSRSRDRLAGRRPEPSGQEIFCFYVPRPFIRPSA